MQEGKLIKLLKALTKEEFRNLENYINSPFFLRKNKDALLLYKAIKRQYPHFQSSVLLKRRVFKKVYPDQDYADGKMRNLLTKVVKITESYLLYLDQEENKFERNKQLMIIYGKRNIDNEFIKGIKNLKKQLKVSPYRDADYFLQLYHLNKHLYFSSNTPKDKKSLLLLKEALTSFESYFVLNRIDFVVELQNRNKIFKENHQFKIDDFSKILPKNNLIYQVYYKTFQLLEHQKYNDFNDLKKIFIENIQLLNEKDQTIVFTVLQNFISHQFSINEAKFIPFALELYEIALSEKIIFKNGELGAIFFLNIAILSSKIKRFNWTEQYIEEYSAFLPFSVYEMSKNLAYGYLEFHKGHYLNTIDRINKVNNLGNLYIAKTTILSIRSYFKLFLKQNSYFEVLNSLCAAHIRLLERNQRTAKRKIQSNLELIKVIKRIINALIKDKWSLEKKEETIDFIRKTTIKNKGWLLEEISKI